jgi:hypothetical protein
MGGTVEKILRPNTEGITKSSTSLNPAFMELGSRTVENTLKTKHKEKESQKEAHHSIPCFHR